MLSEMNSFSTPRMSPYTLFVTRNREQFSLENPELSSVLISEKLASAWATLTPEQRSIYNEETPIGKYNDPFDESFKLKNNDVSIAETVVNAASDIAQIQQPTDPQSFIDWLGAQIIHQYYTENGCLPQELIEYLENETFLSQHQENIIKSIIDQQNFVQFH